MQLAGVCMRAVSLVAQPLPAGPTQQQGWKLLPCFLIHTMRPLAPVTGAGGDPELPDLHGGCGHHAHALHG